MISVAASLPLVSLPAFCCAGTLIGFMPRNIMSVKVEQSTIAGLVLIDSPCEEEAFVSVLTGGSQKIALLNRIGFSRTTIADEKTGEPAIDPLGLKQRRHYPTTM
jgi:hypothetical protein